MRDQHLVFTKSAVRRTLLVGIGRTTTFAILFFLAAFAQTILLTVLPVEAFRLLGSARELSLVYLMVGICGFTGRLAIPSLALLVGRPRLLLLGTAVLLLSCVLLAGDSVPALIVGFALNTFAFACFEIVFNLYVLENIARSELGRFEAKRIFFAAAPWTIGPWLGIYLQSHAAFWLPFLISGATGLLMLAYFWLLRLEPPLEPRASRRLNPIYSIARFTAQPRLRLSWVLAVGRNAWWSMFQVYVPVYAIKTGLGAEAGGLIVSIGVGWMWTVLIWGWLGRRIGIRRLLLLGYAATGCITLATVPAMGTPLLGAVMLVMSAFVAETIDGAGNSLFLRAVHVHERSEMTAVFVTYRDFGQTAPPAIFAALLAVFELPAVFVAGGAMMLGMAVLTRYIPRRF